MKATTLAVEVLWKPRPDLRPNLVETSLHVADPAGMKAANRTSGARLRIVLEPDIAIGPGKADVLEGIRETGSIAAAGRRLGMSYKRAWLLVDSMNACFRHPLVETSRGGQTRGGAVLTPDGEKVLACYRRMESLTAQAIEDEMASLRVMLVDRRDR